MTQAKPKAKKAKAKTGKPLLPEEKAAPAAPAKKTSWKDWLGLSALPALSVKSPFATPEITVDLVNDEVEIGRADRALKALTRNAILIACVGCVLSFGAPFFQPIFIYHTMTPEGRIQTMVPLDMPNLTNPAIVSWAATSVTEIMSFGFGEIEAKTVAQKKRFTRDGWDAFVKAFMGNSILDTFRRHQLVLTTVPSDTPVISSQGVNEDGVYQWVVDVPVIMNYAANDNLNRAERGNVEMTIVRVPYEQSTSGVAIDIWKHGH